MFGTTNAGVLKLLYHPVVNWNYSSEPTEGSGGRRIHWPRGKTLGGSSSINGMLYVRGNARNPNPPAPGAGAAPGGGAGRTVRGRPLIKPPYGTLTAIDLNKGEILWQVAHGDTPDNVKALALTPRLLALARVRHYFSLDRRRYAEDGIDVGPGRRLHELARVCIERFEITPLPFGEHDVERERALAAARNAGDDCWLSKKVSVSAASQMSHDGMQSVCAWCACMRMPNT